MSADPAMADGLNWYRYANNNPLIYMDPTGLNSESVDNDTDEALNAVIEAWQNAQSEEEKATIISNYLKNLQSNQSDGNSSQPQDRLLQQNEDFEGQSTEETEIRKWGCYFLSLIAAVQLETGVTLTKEEIIALYTELQGTVSSYDKNGKPIYAIGKGAGVNDSQIVLNKALAYINSKGDTGVVSMTLVRGYVDGASYHISHGYVGTERNKTSTHFELARGGFGVTKSNADIIYRAHSGLDTLGPNYETHEFRSITVQRRS